MDCFTVSEQERTSFPFGALILPYPCSETTGSSCFFPHRGPHLCHVMTLDGWATGRWPGVKMEWNHKTHSLFLLEQSTDWEEQLFTLFFRDGISNIPSGNHGYPHSVSVCHGDLTSPSISKDVYVTQAWVFRLLFSESEDLGTQLKTSQEELFLGLRCNYWGRGALFGVARMAGSKPRTIAAKSLPQWKGENQSGNTVNTEESRARRYIHRELIFWIQQYLKQGH